TQIGVRTLRQPVVENLFTFIASSNNNIKRITMLMEKFCTRYGQKIETEKGDFYTFPSIQTVAQDQDIEQTMQGLGFGYRAKYYAKTIEYLMRMGDPDEYLHKLRVEPLEIARGELIKLSGVGPKVADCVLLMSLDKSDAVPVDTHIWQVAQRRYVGRLADSSSNSTDMLLPPGKDEQIRQLARQLRAFKTPSTKAYELAQSLIVMLFGPYAGWAQGMLFSGDLKNGVDTAAAKPKPTKRKAQQPPAATLTESALGSATPEPRRAGLRRRPYP
ncbi:8-oxoguanine glycosylase ogg1, partial [Coemansia thaxteri]